MLRGCTLHASRRCAPAETPPRRDRGPPFAARLARRYARLYAYAASQGNAAKPGKIRYGVTRLTPSAPLRAQRRRTAYIQIHSSPIRRFLSCRRCPPCVSSRPTKMGKPPKKCMPLHATALNLCLTRLLPEARSRATTTRRSPNDTRTRDVTEDRTSALNWHCASA